LLLRLLLLCLLLATTGGSQPTEHNVCRAEDALVAATARKLRWVRWHTTAIRLPAISAVLANTVTPQRIRHHAAVDWRTRESRPLALGHGPFPTGQARPYLPFLFLLDGLAAVLLGQLVVIYFCERGHGALSLGLGLGRGACVVRTE